MGLLGICAAGLMVLALAACTASQSGPTPVRSSSGTTSASARSPSGTPAATPPDERDAGAATVVVNGDLLWHNTLWYGAKEDARRGGHSGRDDYDFRPLLSGIKPVVAGADLAICHEEVPLAPRGGPYRNYPRFAAPPHVVAAIKATGYDLCTTSSNHALDQGFAGLKRTLDALDRAGIRHVGTNRTARAAKTPVMFTTRSGVKIGVVAATFSTNGIPAPPGKSWAVNRLSAGSLLDQAKRAKASGADIVLAAVHAGTEHSPRENDRQRELARELTASSNVDLVYMHHSHTVQPWTKVNGKWVVYGLGNTVAQHQENRLRSHEGVTARFTFTRDDAGHYRVAKAEYIPTLVTRYAPGKPARLLQVSAALPTARGALRERLVAAKRRTAAVVTAHDPPGLAES
jgi:poly-gamma-glutamate capsule biosynthesis protein CapA/YwtB (metallophosphatase superfamily)